MFARALAASILAASTLTAGPASAQTYPSRPVTMIVAFPPGGVDDTIARMIQPALEKALNQTIVVENLGGAGGMIAAAKAAHATPDGYTILLHQDSLAAGATAFRLASVPPNTTARFCTPPAVGVVAPDGWLGSLFGCGSWPVAAFAASHELKHRYPLTMVSDTRAPRARDS